MAATSLVPAAAQRPDAGIKQSRQEIVQNFLDMSRTLQSFFQTQTAGNINPELLQGAGLYNLMGEGFAYRHERASAARGAMTMDLGTLEAMQELCSSLTSYMAQPAQDSQGGMQSRNLTSLEAVTVFERFDRVGSAINRLPASFATESSELARLFGAFNLMADGLNRRREDAFSQGRESIRMQPGELAAMWTVSALLEPHLSHGANPFDTVAGPPIIRKKPNS